MTFTKLQQEKHRKSFIDECRQKAWGAACHADWISKGVDDVMAHYQKLQAEDRALEEAIKAAEVAVDYHTVENRNKRKSMQERRNTLAQQMKLVSENAQRGQQSLQQLYASMESNLALAKHAEGWEWKEAKGNAEEEITKTHGDDKYRFTKDWVDHEEGEIVAGVDIGDGVIFKDLLGDGVIEKVV